MGNHNKVADLPQQTMKYIDNKAFLTSKAAGLSYQDEEDLKQYLRLCAIRARDRFNKTKAMALESYLHMEVDAKTKNFLRDRLAGKRVKILLTLNTKIPTVDEESELEVIDVVESEREEQLERDIRREAVRYAVANMHGVEREVCRLLMRGVLKKDIPARIGVNETKFWREIMPSVVSKFSSLYNG